MKQYIKWMAAALGLYLAAGEFEAAGNLSRAMIVGIGAIGALLYHFDARAEHRHSQIINRLDRLWGRGAPPGDDT